MADMETLRIEALQDDTLDGGSLALDSVDDLAGFASFARHSAASSGLPQAAYMSTIVCTTSKPFFAYYLMTLAGRKVLSQPWFGPPLRILPARGRGSCGRVTDNGGIAGLQPQRV